MRRIAVTGGGTAGHIFPAVEFLKAYRREFDAEGYFIGCAGGLESRLVPMCGERLEFVTGLPYACQSWDGKLAAIVTVAPAIRAASRLLLRYPVQLVIGTGGYASFGVCLAACLMGVPTVIHEANAEPGLANRTLAHFAQLVCVGFEESAARFGGPPVQVTGTPARFAARTGGSQESPFRFLVMGGSQGSPMLNREAPRLFSCLRQKSIRFSVCHLAGVGDPETIRRAYAMAGVDCEVKSFVEDLAPLYAASSFVISCAGGVTLAELAMAGLPSLLVPLATAANDHQTANARIYAAQTGSAWSPEHLWNAGEQASWIESVMRDPSQLERMRRGALARARPDAARDVVAACEEMLGSVRRPGMKVRWILP